MVFHFKCIEKVKELALGIGYCDCSVITSRTFEEYKESINEREKEFLNSRDLLNRMHTCIDPKRKRSWVKNIVIAIRRYGKYKLPDGNLSDHFARNYLFDRRHPASPENNWPKKMTEGLKKLGFKVKRGGGPCRAAAVRGGLGRYARNSFIYNKFGSWINIETWSIDKELVKEDLNISKKSICPDGCDKCMVACPTKALYAPYKVRPDRCISYLTYNSDKPSSKELGSWIYGCDICQLVCPLNQGKWEEIEKADWIEEIKDYLTLESIIEMNQETFESILNPLFPYIPITDLKRWKIMARRALELKKMAR